MLNEISEVLFTFFLGFSSPMVIHRKTMYNIFISSIYTRMNKKCLVTFSGSFKVFNVMLHSFFLLCISIVYL